jgi:hypothetical protein
MANWLEETAGGERTHHHFFMYTHKTVELPIQFKTRAEWVDDAMWDSLPEDQRQYYMMDHGSKYLDLKCP